MVKKVLPGSWKVSLGLAAVLITACDPEKPEQDRPVSPKTGAEQAFSPVAPEFNPDSAYAYIEKQVSFGPRVPNTEAHKKTGDFLIKKLESFGLAVQVQEAKVTAFNNTVLNIRNIIASHRPEATARIMLFAHWDTRPFADQDDKNRTQPIPGANDGGSGVGVLLEIARQLSLKQASVGVDIILFDAEDYGQPEGTMLERKNDTYCLGSQYWARNLHTPDYSPKYGILLDMVGAEGALFTKEGTSMYYAPFIVKKVWDIAKKLGYDNHFVDRHTDAITDDHYYVNALTGIPAIDIIEFNPHTPSNFGPYWHTHEDDMDVIDKNTLKAVGQTVLEVVFREQ